VSSETVFVKILDKEYQVACGRDERADLLQSAELLDERMRTIKRGGTVIGLERIAVMAALNLSHELLQAKRELASVEPGPNRDALRRLHERLDRCLEQLT